MNPALVEAVIWQESRGDPRAVSPVGARGLMQVMPDTARSPGFGIQPVDPDQLFDPEVNRRFGEQYLGAMLNRYNGDTDRALVAYNWGPGNADKWDGTLDSLPEETRQYVTNINMKMAANEPRQGYSLEELLAERARRQGAAETPSPQGYTLDQLLAEKARRQAQSVPDKPANGRTGFNEAAETMVNDLNAGFQGVNPIGVAETPPIGVVRRDADGNVTGIEQDGVTVDPAGFTGDKYVTQIDPQTGLEMVYPRTEENAASMAESAGRVLGFGLPTATGRPAAAVKTGPDLAAAERIGVTPSLGMTGKTGAMLAGAGDANIVTAGTIAKDAARAADETAAAAARIADTAGPGASQLDGGAALTRGKDEFVGAFKAKSDELYSAVDKAIPQGTRIEARNFGMQLEEYLKLYGDTPNIGASTGVGKMKGWAEDLLANGGQLTWEQMKAFRSDIGAALSRATGELGDQNTARLKQMYAALTKDMEAGAKANGALGPWLRANRFYQAGRQRIDEALDIVFKAKSEEQAFNRAFALTAEKGGGANLKKLGLLKRSMPPEEWKTFVGTVIRRMGAPTPGAAGVVEEGAFSANRFLTEWNKMAPQAKALMFQGKGLPKTLRPALDDLAEVAEMARDAGGQINRSRTGAALQTAALAAGGVTFTAPVVIGALTAYGSAKLMTQPGVLRALASYGKTGSKRGLERLASQKGTASVEATNLLRLIAQEEAS